jgi:hypothetical protein
MSQEVPGNLMIERCPPKVVLAQTTRVKERMLEPQTVLDCLSLDFHADNLKDDRKISQDDFEFLRQMEKKIVQHRNGFYSMPLPFRERPQLPNNRLVALKRFQLLQRRLSKDDIYRQKYVEFMDNLILHREAERVPHDEITSAKWYIPHHGVINPRKPDKLRVVFDCSAKCRGQALNDYLLQGPDLTNSLLGVLCRFRKGAVAITCDIERMFHMFKVHRDDQDYLRFLWFDKAGNIVDYRMKVHLFGATSSPGCANFGLKRLAEDYKAVSSCGSDFIKNNFYVDDGLISVNTVEHGIQLMNDTKEICSKGNLRLHKFASNSLDVLQADRKSVV